MRSPFSTTGYPLAFCAAMNFVLEHEGGYVNDPNDTGGETKFGISKRSYPQEDIAALKVDDAVAIYWKDYWLKAGCDALPETTGFMLFDACIQHGQRNAMKQLQRAVGVTDDGIVGSNTLKAIKNASPLEVISLYSLQRGRFYADLIARKPHQKRFLNGWFNRIQALAVAALRLL